MAIDMSDEIVQDFLVEAGEILEQLGTQLVDLEQRPFDTALLNSVFRGFHTIKGGAGFLGLDNLVEVSHKAEDVFDLLRRGERTVDARLMDVILKVLDTLNDMFQSIRSGQEPGAAAPELLASLVDLQAPAASAVPAKPVAAPVTEAVPAADVAAAAPAATEPQVEPPSHSSDDITESEFEALLDTLHGKGRHGAAAPAAAAEPTSAGAGDDISESEFEALLDALHGPGRFVASAAAEAKLDPHALPPGLPLPAAPAEPERSVVQPSAAAMTPAPVETAEAGGARNPKQASTQADTTVRVETAVLDQIMNMVGELVLIRNRLATLETSIGNQEMTKTVQNLDIVTSDLQSAAMKTRMQPIKKVFGRFPRVVRDLARSMRKEIELELDGEDTDLDKNLVEALADPLVHLVRNSCDHGIELPDVRERAGKARQGRVRLAAEQSGDHILLTISDDGAGMDPERLRRKAVERGMMDEDAAARLDDRDAFNLIFAAGFSTKSEVSDISGRGVGMDVVKTRINQLNGQIEVRSEPGVGTTIEIKVPLTLAIMPTLMVVLGSQIFALPLVSVNEILDYDLSRRNVVDGQEVVLVRGKALPLFYLSRWLVRGIDDYGASTGHVVIVSVGTQRIGLLVDQLVGQEEVVIKPLGALLHGIQGLSGATITGDGRIALIIDLPGLVNAYARRR